MLKYSDTTPAPFEAHLYQPAEQYQADSDNGAGFYGAITLGTMAGVAFGIFTNQLFVGLFAGIGAGAVLGLGLIAGRQIIDRFAGR